MKPFISRLFFLIAVCLIGSAAHAGDTPSLAGTWELVTGEFIDGEGNLMKYDQAKISSRKVLTDTDFFFISHKDGQFWAASTGRYNQEGGQYVETPELLSYPLPEGSSYTFSFKLEGDNWYTERFEEGKRVEFEHWARVR